MLPHNLGGDKGCLDPDSQRENVCVSGILLYNRVSDPYLFYDCGPLGDSERRQGEGRPASIGFQLLSVKKL